MVKSCFRTWSRLQFGRSRILTPVGNALTSVCGCHPIDSSFTYLLDSPGSTNRGSPKFPMVVSATAVPGILPPPPPPPLPHSDCLLLRPSEEVGYDRKSWSGLLSFAITGRMQVDWTGGVLWSHLEKGRHSSWHNISAPPALSGLLEIQRSWTAQSMTSSYLLGTNFVKLPVLTIAGW